LADIEAVSGRIDARWEDTATRSAGRAQRRTQVRAKYALLATAAVLMTAAPRLWAARNIEISPYAGYRWSSALSGTSAELEDGTMMENLDFESGAAFGLRFDYRVENRLMLELTAEGFPSRLEGTQSPSGEKSDAFEVVLYYLQLGLQYEIIEYGVAVEEVRIRPFVYAGLGSTWFDPAGDRKSNARLNAAFAAGFKFMLNERLGLRAQGRYIWTYIRASNDYFCTGGGEQCTVFPVSVSLSQIDLTLGLIITL
jgi:outer membrane protein W